MTSGDNSTSEINRELISAATIQTLTIMLTDNKTPQEIISSLMLENAKLVAQLKELRDYLDDMVKEINKEVGL